MTRCRLGSLTSCHSRPRARVRALAEEVPAVHWDRVLFSAKESVYKAWFPLTRRWLGFEEADITIEAGDGSGDGIVDATADGTFNARFLVPGPVIAGRPLAGFSGRWLSRGGLVLTAV